MKRFLIALGALLVGQFASAAYLQWQVIADNSEGTGTAGTGVGTYNEARVVAYKDGVKIVLDPWSDGSGSYEGWMGAYENGDSTLNFANVDGLEDGYSFYIELGYYDIGSDSDTIVGATTTPGMTYQALHEAGFIVTGAPGEFVSPTPWHGSGYAIPEPTGGVLMLMGLGLLALKRKRVEKVA